MGRSTNALLAACAALLIAAPCAAQLSGGQLMEEGNALARAGIYRTALLRYREAAAAGLDSPLLHYNLGVTYYRLGEYDDAAPGVRACRRGAGRPARRARRVQLGACTARRGRSGHRRKRVSHSRGACARTELETARGARIPSRRGAAGAKKRRGRAAPGSRATAGRPHRGPSLQRGCASRPG